MKQRKNLVMGAIGGYTMKQLRPFVLSLQKSGFKGDICFLYLNLSDETINDLRQAGVLLVPMKYHGKGSLNSWSRFWKWLKPLATVLGTTMPGRSLMKMITPLQTSRFYGYRDFLLEHQDEYQNVLITDVRDVVFQADPFRNFVKTKVQCYEEDRKLSEDTQFNLPWIWQLYGRHSADSFIDTNIVCSGTILGPVGKMIEYIGIMEKTLIRANDVGVGGSDQGLHNYVLRTKKHDADIVRNGEGEVLTVFEPNISQYRMIDGLFCLNNGEVIPVIHQYDRSKELEVKLIKRLSLS